MPGNELLAVLKDALITVRGLQVEFVKDRQHSTTNDEFILYAIRDLTRVLWQIQVELTREKPDGG